MKGDVIDWPIHEFPHRDIVGIPKESLVVISKFYFETIFI